MIIIVDLEGKKVISQLCDVALRAGGLQNLYIINKVLSSVVLNADKYSQSKLNKPGGGVNENH